MSRLRLCRTPPDEQLVNQCHNHTRSRRKQTRQAQKLQATKNG